MSAGADYQAVAERVNKQYVEATERELAAFLAFMRARDESMELAKILGIPHGYPTRRNPTADLRDVVTQSSATIYRFEAIVRVLQAAGHPMQLRGIVDALTSLPDGGYSDATVHQTLKANPDVFPLLRRGIYDLAPAWRKAPPEQVKREAVMRAPAMVRESRNRKKPSNGPAAQEPE